MFFKNVFSTCIEVVVNQFFCDLSVFLKIAWYLHTYILYILLQKHFVPSYYIITSNGLVEHLYSARQEQYAAGKIRLRKKNCE